PVVSGERPHLTVTVDLEALEGRAGRRCELDEGGVITPEAARRLACDASVARVVTAGRSEPLDVGRRTPVVPPARLRAAGGLVRRAPRGALGRRWFHRALQPGAALPAASPGGAPAVRGEDGAGTTRVPQAGRVTARGSRPSVAATSAPRGA